MKRTCDVCGKRTSEDDKQALDEPWFHPRCLSNELWVVLNLEDLAAWIYTI